MISVYCSRKCLVEPLIGVMPLISVVEAFRSKHKKVASAHSEHFS